MRAAQGVWVVGCVDGAVGRERLRILYIQVVLLLLLLLGKLTRRMRGEIFGAEVSGVRFGSTGR